MALFCKPIQPGSPARFSELRNREDNCRLAAREVSTLSPMGNCIRAREADAGNFRILELTGNEKKPRQSPDSFPHQTHAPGSQSR
jgi:hypothetical protein